MKRIMKQKYSLLLTMLYSLVLVFSACTRDNDIDIPQTSVNKITETTVNVGDEMTFTGSNMHLITKVTFGETEAEVNLELAKRDKHSLTVTVPALLVTQKVRLFVTYNTNKKIVLSEELEVIVPPVVPTVTSSLPSSVMSGNIVELEGTGLDIIKSIFLGSTEITYRSKDERSISFVAPEVETEVSVQVKFIYDNSLGSNKELLVGTLTIEPLPVIKVLEWKDVVIGGQGTFRSFFDGSTGIIYTPCDLFDNQEKIDFMMNVSNAGENQFYNPGNATNVLKNQLCDGKALGTEDGKDYSKFLAVGTKFRQLTTSGAQGALALKVKNKEIDEITDALFEGISAPSSNTPKNFTVGDVVWFYNATKDKNGLIEIKEVIAGATPQENTIKMDVYYQK